MSPVDKNIKKAAPFLLFRQIVFAAACTAVILFLCRNIYLSSDRFVHLSFNIQYSNQVGNHWQIFYKSGDSRKLNIMQPVLMRYGQRLAQTISLPCRTLEWIRFDFGSEPGKVEMSNILLQGEQQLSIGDMIQKSINQINDLRLTGNGINCSSSGIDPSLSFQLKKPLAGKRSLDCWALIIIAFSAFIIFLAAARLFTFPQMQFRWLYLVDSLLAAIFLVFLFIPISHVDDRKVSVAEKRPLAPFRPLVSSDMKINYQFGRNFDAWFNDHFFGRSALLDLNAFIFLKTKNPIQSYGNVYSGFDGWYFYSRENALRNYHNLDLFSEKDLARAAESLNKIQEICRRKGKKLYLIMVPDKHKVYGEYFPGAPKIRPDSQSRARQLENYLKTHTSVHIINLLDSLLANKKQGLLYWKNSTHWNEMGAYLSYLEVMRHINKDFPDTPMAKIYTIKPKKTTLRGDLNALSNGDLIPDNTLYPLPHFTLQYKVVGDSIGVPFGSSQMLNPKGKYNVLILRDSFSSSLLPYMGSSFKTITALWSGYRLPQNRIKAFNDADIVIFECVDRLLPFLLTGIYVTRVNLENGVR